MAGIGLFMAAWFGYDGLIGYPREQQRSLAYEQLSDEITDKKELYEKWRQLARSKGWNVETPNQKSAEFENKITGQFVFGGLCLAFAVPVLMLYLVSRNRWIDETDEGLKTSWGATLDFRTVNLLNKSRWASKGIAKAHFEHEGRKGVFVFDDFKYDRQPLGNMLRRLESTLKPEQIIGGEPETDDASVNSPETTGGGNSDNN